MSDCFPLSFILKEYLFYKNYSWNIIICSSIWARVYSYSWICQLRRWALYLSHLQERKKKRNAKHIIHCKGHSIQIKFLPEEVKKVSWEINTLCSSPPKADIPLLNFVWQYLLAQRTNYSMTVNKSVKNTKNGDSIFTVIGTRGTTYSFGSH